MENHKEKNHRNDLHRSVFALYPDRPSVERAVESLKANSFRPSDISVLAADTNGSGDFCHERHTKAPEGTVLGAIILGGICAVLFAFGAVGAVNLPGVESMMDAGSFFSFLAGFGFGGILGGFVGACIGVTIPEFEARRFEGMARDGGVLVAVHTDNPEWVRRAKSLLKGTGAHDICIEREVPGLRSALQSGRPL